MNEWYNETPGLGGALEQLAIGAGCSSAAARVAEAIAMAESGGNPRAHNPNPPDDSYGLWQINMLGPLGPARRSQFGLTSNDQLYDPSTNARAMVAISGGCSNWRPWSTFTNGAYRNFLSPAVAGGDAGSAPDPPAAPDPGSGYAPETFSLPVDLFSGLPGWAGIAALGVAAYLLLR